VSNLPLGVIVIYYEWPLFPSPLFSSLPFPLCYFLVPFLSFLTFDSHFTFDFYLSAAVTDAASNLPLGVIVIYYEYPPFPSPLFSSLPFPLLYSLLFSQPSRSIHPSRLIYFSLLLLLMPRLIFHLAFSSFITSTLPFPPLLSSLPFPLLYFLVFLSLSSTLSFSIILHLARFTFHARFLSLFCCY
jgi:hypothetical protein